MPRARKWPRCRRGQFLPDSQIYWSAEGAASSFRYQDNSGLGESFRPLLSAASVNCVQAEGPFPAHFPGSHLRYGRADCVAGHVGLELRNVVTNYPVESSIDFRESSRIPAPQRQFPFELRRWAYAARASDAK